MLESWLLYWAFPDCCIIELVTALLEYLDFLSMNSVRNQQRNNMIKKLLDMKYSNNVQYVHIS